MLSAVLIAVLGMSNLGGNVQVALPKTHLTGIWVPSDPRSSLSRLEVSAGESGLVLHVWANSTRDVIDWGEVPLEIYGDSVESAQFNFGFAVFEEAFGTIKATLRFDNGRVVFETLTMFTDDSGRTNYHSADKFRRL